MSQLKSTLSESIHKCFQLISNGNSLSSLTSKSEELRKDYAEQLRKANVDKEALSNTLSKIRQAKQLNEVKFEIVEEQLKFLYDSMQNLFGNKNKNDSKKFEEIVEKKRVTEVIQEKDSLQSQLNLTQQLLEQTRQDLLTMTDIFRNQSDSNKTIQKDLKTKMQDLE